MTRTLSGGETSESGIQAVWLMELVFWDTSTSSEVIHRLTTAPEDIDADPDGGGTETYTGAGDFIKWGGAQETSDQRAQGTRIQLSGVDTVIMSALLNNRFHGRRIRIWRARIEDGAVTDTRLAHRGVQLEDYEIEGQRPEEEGEPATAAISTRSVSRLAALQRANPVRATRSSHDAMLARAGLSVGDTAFKYLPNLGRFFWGSEAPASATDGSSDGSSAGSGAGSTGDQPSGPVFKPPF